MKVLYRKEQGFSLIEVNLAIFVVGAGLLVLFSLFPLGLRESDMGVADTQEAMFADFVLNGMEGNSMTNLNCFEWETRNFVLTEVPETPPMSPPVQFEFPVNSKNYVRYTLSVSNYPGVPCYDQSAFPYPPGVPSGRKKVILMVKSGKYGKFSEETKCYITELIYQGM